MTTKKTEADHCGMTDKSTDNHERRVDARALTLSKNLHLRGCRSYEDFEVRCTADRVGGVFGCGVAADARAGGEGSERSEGDRTGCDERRTGCGPARPLALALS